MAMQPVSALALIPDGDREDGMRRPRADLDSGEWHRHRGFSGWLAHPGLLKDFEEGHYC